MIEATHLECGRAKASHIAIHGAIARQDSLPSIVLVIYVGKVLARDLRALRVVAKGLVAFDDFSEKGHLRGYLTSDDVQAVSSSIEREAVEKRAKEPLWS